VGWSILSFAARRLLGYGELLAAVALWGSLYPASKPVLVHISPELVALVRAAIAFLVLGALTLVRGAGRQAVWEVRHQPWPSASLGLLSFFFSSLLAMLSVRYLPASVVGMILATSPLWLSLATIALRKPPGSARVLLGAVIALAGVGMVLFRDGVAVPLTGGGLDPRGVAFALLCAVVIAMQAAWGRRVMIGRDPLVVTCLGCGWSLPPLVVLAAAEGGMGDLLALPETALGILLYLGIGCTAVNFALFNHALKRVPAHRAAAFQYLVPFIRALLAHLFLGESLTWPLIVGGLATVLGIVLTQQGSSENHPAPRPQ